MRGDGDVRVAWDVGFPGVDAPWSDEAQERAAEGVWSRALKAEVRFGCGVVVRVCVCAYR